MPSGPSRSLPHDLRDMSLGGPPHPRLALSPPGARGTLALVADPAVFVMFYVVLSQQKVSRELLTAPATARGCGAHLRKQVQDSVTHGTGGVGPFPAGRAASSAPSIDR